MNSRKVTIKRAPVISTLPDEILNESVRKIGSALTRSGSVLKGITFEEERKFLPGVVGIPADHIEFMRKCDNWYSNMNIPVSNDGVTLEVGTTEDGAPLNLMEWLKYKFILAHPAVAPSKQLSEANLNYAFYIEDMEEEIRATNKKVNASKEAYKEFLKLSEDEEKMDSIIRVMAPIMGESPSVLKTLKSKEEKENKLDSYLKKNPTLFTELCKDKDLEFKSEIEAMIDAQILTKIGNKIIYGSDPIGNNINEAIAFLKSAGNSDVYTILKAKLEQLGTIPSKPKTKKEKVTHAD